MNDLDLLSRLDAHIRQMAPHVARRQTAQLLMEAREALVHGPEKSTMEKAWEWFGESNYALIGYFGGQVWAVEPMRAAGRVQKEIGSGASKAAAVLDAWRNSVQTPAPGGEG